MTSPGAALAVTHPAVQAAIPSPTQGVWHLGPLPLRAYALCIIVGIVVAVWLGDRRYRARGGPPNVVVDVAAWAVPFGIVGGRLYHLVTNPELYFAAGKDPVRALYIWQGGLGIWGAIALGAVGAYIGARRAGVLMPPLADALAPGILAAQAIGRWGNWFNNELYGRETDLPWALKVYAWDTGAGRAEVVNGQPVVAGYYHPTFLYESLWSAAGVAVLLWADRRFRLGHGRVFALYVAVYTSGRLWIETLRINDDANIVLGLRVNVWVSALVLVTSVVAFVVMSRRFPGRERVLVRGAAAEEGTPDGAPAAADGTPDKAPDSPAPDASEQDGSGTRPT